MRTVSLTSALILAAATAGGTALLAQSGTAQNPILYREARLLRATEIPLRDAGGAQVATLAFYPGAGGKGAVTITDRSGARIELLAAGPLTALPGLEESRIRLPSAAGQDGKSDSGSDARYLKEELRKLDARIRQVESKLGR